jgi:hypothetical protein
MLTESLRVSRVTAHREALVIAIVKFIVHVDHGVSVSSFTAVVIAPDSCTVDTFNATDSLACLPTHCSDPFLITSVNVAISEQ